LNFELYSQSSFLFWIFLPVQVIKDNMEQIPNTILRPAPKKVFVPHPRGFRTDSPGNKATCQPYAAGTMRFPGGTIPAISSAAETPGEPIVSSLPNKGGKIILNLTQSAFILFIWVHLRLK
jgi:hypothetical protein